MKNKKFDLVTLSPLLLLVLIPLINIFISSLTKTAANPEITIFKYFLIPMIGFSIGSLFFLGIIRNNWSLNKSLSDLIKTNLLKIIVIVSGLFSIYLATLAVLRYSSLHTTVFDMGMYDKKIWKISTASFLNIFHEFSTGHFQPILYIYALIYKVVAYPEIIQVIQAITIISGILPLYLIAKEKLNSKPLILSVVLIYLFYPPIAFNAALEFHPDHLYVPLMLWAFYFVEKDKYLFAILLSAIASMAKEPYILGAAFFGIYIALAKKKYRIGITSFILFIGFFLMVIFQFLPHINQINTIDPNAFPGLTAGAGNTTGLINIKSLINTILMWKVRKVLFIFFLLTPLLYLPIFSWKRFIPALPFFLIPLLSRSSLHSSIDSQYTAGIIAPAIVAYIFSIKKINEKYGEKYANAFMTFSLILTFTFSIANGPYPFSINFFKPGWSKMWHKSSYVSTDHEKVIKKAINKISKDPKKTVISQGNINHKDLAHRLDYDFFPRKLKKADYILLDLKKSLMVGDYVDEELFMEKLGRIRENPSFKLEFSEYGVLLFTRFSNL